jgi:hypothetical protein
MTFFIKMELLTKVLKFLTSNRSMVFLIKKLNYNKRKQQQQQHQNEIQLKSKLEIERSSKIKNFIFKISNTIQKSK